MDMTKSACSPCRTCTRVLAPMDCDNKKCKVWQTWFLGAWNRLHQYPRLVMSAPAEPVGVVLGGCHYAAPNQVRDYLATDPCSLCRSTEDVCRVPCRARKAWCRTVEELGQ